MDRAQECTEMEDLEPILIQYFFFSPSLSAKGDVDGLYAWYLAGADLEQTGYDGRNPLQVVSVHTAVLHMAC